MEFLEIQLTDGSVMHINESPEPRSSMWAWIAYQLRIQRRQRGMSGHALAKLLNCARSSISRLENSEAKLTDAQAGTLDKEWNTGNLFKTMVRYAWLGHDANWFKTFTDSEGRASVLKIYSGQLVPALLQTPNYARALLVEGREPGIDALVEARMARQKILAKDGPADLWVLLAETALPCLVGGKAVMREQLARLVELSQLPNVTLRIVPNTAGANAGLDGPFKIIKVKEGQVGYVEAPTGGRLVADASEVDGLVDRFDRIGAVALPVDSSRSLIEQLRETM
ncbi:helix-turn-helix domain-containing protein [Actinomadura algeriensis]|uniref:Transcriptional regulator with XRE-family HTH domain n=1 Tax=Actinomadura algeriensis TaxID=1679523 RepID=A0ABR9JYH8_9ACTN|nr:helix-turn-helix transcriptional regulator [Actinomadura algeriensis]MBE1535613.1 transcriptional regulator with XRE-family HTH domain [Actinomadura algeriensis]